MNKGPAVHAACLCIQLPVSVSNTTRTQVFTLAAVLYVSSRQSPGRSHPAHCSYIIQRTMKGRHPPRGASGILPALFTFHIFCVMWTRNPKCRRADRTPGLTGAAENHGSVVYT